MIDEELRYELNKMKYNYYKEAGIFFLRNNAPTKNPHWHDCYEIEYIVSGRATERINDCEYEAIPRDIFLLTPNDFHQFVDYTENITIVNIMFPEEIIWEQLLSKLETKAFNMNVFARLEEDESEKVKALVSVFEKEIEQKKSGYVQNVHSIINIIVSIILRERFKENNVGGQYSSVKRAIDYIKNNFQKPLTLVDVAKEVNLEPNYFSSIFSKKLKTTFKSFLNEIRLNNAVKELKNSEKSILDICYSSGYGSISNFNRMFKKRYGMSPREYRQKQGIKT